ncbi:MAG TPA: hypothetical protein VFB36_03665 [Nevskiaceae bacterium]|nr:hypothetical protein [Nevskiaceae bacterium]
MNPEDRLQERLRALPNVPPPADGWPALESALRARKQQRVRIAFALAASLLVSFSAVLMLPKPDPIITSAPPRVAQAQDVASLMARSRALESHLAQMREDVPVWDERSAARAARLEGELSLVDLQLSGAEPNRAQRLWRDRVELLNKLVRTHQNAGLINASYTPSTEDHL